MASVQEWSIARGSGRYDPQDFENRLNYSKTLRIGFHSCKMHGTGMRPRKNAFKSYYNQMSYSLSTLGALIPADIWICKSTDNKILNTFHMSGRVLNTDNLIRSLCNHLKQLIYLSLYK
jgi:hypothetical protein